MSNYLVVLFKNKVRKKIIKEFITLDRATKFYENLIKKSDDVIFDVRIENGSECRFEIGLVGQNNNQPIPIYKVDDLGRNVKVKLENNSMSLIKISDFKKEEKVFDVQTNKKITVENLIKKYIRKEGIKMISSINNKIVVQDDENYFIFSLKSEEDTERFIDSLSRFFFKNKRSDCIMVKDYSSAQKKYLLKILEEKGFDKKMLYRKFTTHPRQA